MTLFHLSTLQRQVWSEPPDCAIFSCPSFRVGGSKKSMSSQT